MVDVIDGLREEHRTIARLLDALEHQISVFAEAGDPDYDVLRGLAEYFLEYPDRCHHPKEDIIFARLQQADPTAAAQIGDLMDEHGAIHQAAMQFHAGIIALLNESDIARADIVEAAGRFLDTQRQHLRMEEARFFPVAERRLLPTDWSEIEDALTQRGHPLAGSKVDEDFKKMSDRLIAWAQESD